MMRIHYLQKLSFKNMIWKILKKERKKTEKTEKSEKPTKLQEFDTKKFT